MMGKPRYTVSRADVEDGTTGICVDCGEFASGVEPDARGYTCECCDHKSVYGVEEALMQGLVDLECEDDEDVDDAPPDNGDGDDADPADDGSGIVVDPNAAD